MPIRSTRSRTTPQTTRRFDLPNDEDNLVRMFSSNTTGHICSMTSVNGIKCLKHKAPLTLDHHNDTRGPRSVDGVGLLEHEFHRMLHHHDDDNDSILDGANEDA